MLAVEPVKAAPGVRSHRHQNRNQSDFRPSANRAVGPVTVTLVREPTMVIELTRPPHDPPPVRLLMVIRLSFPMDG